MKEWIEITVKYVPRHLETVSGYFFALGASGAYEREDDFVIYFKSTDWDTEKWFLLKNYLKSTLPGFSDQRLKFGELDEGNWTESWKVHFKPFHAAKNLVVIPEWESYSKSDQEEVLIINPKMAFGTGHHETTQLMLELLPRFLQKGMKVLDAGTGSAILAIYAAMKGAGRVVAFDNDEVAIENAVENSRLNGVSDRISLFTGELSDIREREFDIIVANINRNVLIDLAEPFIDFLKPDGYLLLSGLLVQDLEVIRQVYDRHGWQNIDQLQRGEWLGLILQHGT